MAVRQWVMLLPLAPPSLLTNSTSQRNEALLTMEKVIEQGAGN